MPQKNDDIAELLRDSPIVETARRERAQRDETECRAAAETIARARAKHAAAAPGLRHAVVEAERRAAATEAILGEHKRSLAVAVHAEQCASIALDATVARAEAVLRRLAPAAIDEAIARIDAAITTTSNALTVEDKVGRNYVGRPWRRVIGNGRAVRERVAALRAARQKLDDLKVRIVPDIAAAIAQIEAEVGDVDLPVERIKVEIPRADPRPSYSWTDPR